MWLIYRSAGSPVNDVSLAGLERERELAQRTTAFNRCQYVRWEHGSMATDFAASVITFARGRPQNVQSTILFFVYIKKTLSLPPFAEGREFNVPLTKVLFWCRFASYVSMCRYRKK